MSSRVPRLNRFLEIPLGRSMPLLLGSFAASAVLVFANKAIFNVPPASLTPDFLAAAAEKEGIMERISAPAVFLDPISRGIPGNIRGPDDME